MVWGQLRGLTTPRFASCFTGKLGLPRETLWGMRRKGLVSIFTWRWCLSRELGGVWSTLRQLPATTCRDGQHGITLVFLCSRRKTGFQSCSFFSRLSSGASICVWQVLIAIVFHAAGQGLGAQE
ncbi:hypothetical protein N658DRAFT_298325 [Parathielavia hyrcaniae]|uniref:Uncharacterized protein n=1 Tax=Parathielavia hyrcaniae TaxID=113614 RepID=A0AAN6T3U3_9PEZI|nr:hypothetical protein N658DRAFT_298325 [Parathielavia hyrcaniae]